jgi:rubrerythrin
MRKRKPCEADGNSYNILERFTFSEEYITGKRWTMFSGIPIDMLKLPAALRDKELLRAAIMAELDAVSLYEQMAAATNDRNLKIVFEDVAKEEKTHIGEFQTLLLRLDKDQKSELAAGRKEVEELTK